LLIIFNPTLSLSSIAVGYESFTASGIKQNTARHCICTSVI
jgi:hypothetical protein